MSRVCRCAGASAPPLCLAHPPLRAEPWTAHTHCSLWAAGLTTVCVRARVCAPLSQGGEVTVEQLQEQKRFLEEDRDHEREERNYFQLERDKINTFWEISKKELEDRKAELRNKDREMEELEERHQVSNRTRPPICHVPPPSSWAAPSRLRPR